MDHLFLVDWPGGSWQASLTLIGVVLGIYLAVIWVACIFWAYRDIRQRTRDPFLQSFAVLLVTLLFLPGLWVYLILRPRYSLVELYERSLEEEALLQELEDQAGCPTCRRRVQEDFLVCPSCRTQLKEACRQCTKPLSYAWLACPYCGLEKTRGQAAPIPQDAGVVRRMPRERNGSGESPAAPQFRDVPDTIDMTASD